MARIPKKLIERLVKGFGAKRVSKEAKESIAENMIDRLSNITELAIKNSRHFGRKLITKGDIDFAIKQLRL